MASGTECRKGQQCTRRKVHRYSSILGAGCINTTTYLQLTLSMPCPWLSCGKSRSNSLLIFASSVLEPSVPMDAIACLYTSRAPESILKTAQRSATHYQMYHCQLHATSCITESRTLPANSHTLPATNHTLQLYNESLSIYPLASASATYL